MQHSNELPELIRSMSKQEKRYFSLYASAFTRSRDSATLQLFRKLAGGASPKSDAEWRELLQECGGKNPSALKHRLHEQVLDCLAGWHAEDSVENRLARRLGHVDVLYRKRRLEACLALCDNICAEARRFELHATLLRALQWRRRVLLRLIPAEFEQHMRENAAAVKQTLADCTHANVYLDQVGMFYAAAYKPGLVNSGTGTERLDQLMQDPLMTDIDAVSSFTARLHLLKAHAFYAWIQGRLGAALSWYKRVVDHWQSDPQRIDDAIAVFSADVCNYLTCCIAERRTDQFAALLNRIIGLNNKLRDGEFFRLDRVGFLELSFHLNRGMLNDALELVPVILGGLQRHGARLNPGRRLMLYFNCAVALLLKGEHSRALSALLEVLDARHESVRGDIRDAAKVLRLLLHFELEDFDLLDRLLVSMRQQLQAEHSAPPYGPAFTACIQQALSGHGLTRQLLTDLHGKLMDILELADGAPAPGLPELLFWTESKLRHTTIAEVFTAGARPDKLRDPRTLFRRRNALT